MRDWFMHFPLLLQRKDAKGKQLQEPLLRKGFLKISPKGGAFSLLMRKCFPTVTIFGTLTPSCALAELTLRGGFFLWFKHEVMTEGLYSEGYCDTNPQR